MRQALLRSTLLAACAVGPAPLIAQEIGTAGAVNPASTGTPPARATRTLELGSRLVFRERINTTASGSLQVIFLDKTTLSVGPNSTVTIDEFVYDPNAGTGRLSASMAKGVLRFVGGNISHSGGAQIRTPSATLGIRGGVATIEVTPCAAGAAAADCGTKVTNHFGTLTVTSAAGTEVIRRPGFVVAIPSPAAAPSAPRRVTQAEVDRANHNLTSKPGQSGGSRASEAAVERANVAAPVIAAIGPQTIALQAQTQARPQTVSTPLALAVAPTSLTTVANLQVAVGDVGQQVTTQVVQSVVPDERGNDVGGGGGGGGGAGAAPNAFALAYSTGTTLPGAAIGSPVLGYADGSAVDGQNPTTARILQGSLAVTGEGAGQRSAIQVATGRSFVGSGSRNVLDAGFTATDRGNTAGGLARSAGGVVAAGQDVTIDGQNALSSFTAGPGTVSEAGTVTSAPGSVAVYPGAVRQPLTYAVTGSRIATPAGLGASRPEINSVPEPLFGGFVGGLVTTFNNSRGSASAPAAVSGLFDLSFNPATSRFGTTLGISAAAAGNQEGNALTQAYLDFGSPVDTFYTRPTDLQDGRGTFVDYRNFGAREALRAGGAPSSEVNGAAVTEHRGLFVTADTVNARAAFPNVTLCQCEFTRWGFWSSETGRSAANGDSLTDFTHLGTWVFGPPARAVDIPQTGTATYSGHAVASIQSGTSQYVAAGDFRNVVDFGNRTGAASVTNLDGRSYAGTVSISSGNSIAGSLSTTAGAAATMTMDGQFGRGAAGRAGEMYGSIAITGQNYLGSGIFAGAAPSVPAVSGAIGQ